MPRDASQPDSIGRLRGLVRRVPLLRRATLWLLARAPALRRAVQRRLAAAGDAEYRAWISRHDTLTEADRAAIAARIPRLPPTTISVVMPVFNPREPWLRAAIASVETQLWPHWELCIADDASTAPHVARVLAEAAADPRVKIVRRATNGNISAASNSALALATGKFVALLDHDDLLPDHALYRVAEEIAAHPDADLIYSDEDQLDAAGRRCEPAFKPDFDFDLLRARNFVSHLGVYRRALLLELGGMREGFEGSQDHDLALRVAERASPARIRHIPAVLYHWRQAGAASFSERWLARCADASRQAVADHLARTGVVAEARRHPKVPTAVRVVRALPAPPPLVSVIVPTRDRADLLSVCARGVLRGTDYSALEFLVVDNGSREPATAALLADLSADSRVRVLRIEEKFNFAALCNRAASEARGEVLVLLNNDVEIVEPGWLRELVAHALRPEVGAVGARLLYPSGRVQHAGIVLGGGPDGVAAHLLAGAPRDAPGPGAALWLEREVGAVTGACLAVRRASYLAVGGMDEANLPVAYNDVDLCLRLRAAGLRIVWTPFAELIHHESATRAQDTDPARAARLRRDAAFMRARWGAALLDDPFCNAHYSPTLPFRPGAPRSG
jgi:glycosyltransferase involved in cell wall biosynthesis